ncbi:hypothetical protein VSF3289_04726 [Vibrio scophthalmi]|uniref:Uncharacterized protein n=1 Tax=Vibrio scophthalmi TaxID=45658 RepID=A0A1E3WIF8_9VIBR|nr:hypothetical protein VSF3289_04726 [Vibrio scophthalmi]
MSDYNLIELFVTNFNGVAFIRDYSQDTVLFGNDFFWDFTKYSDSFEQSQEIAEFDFEREGYSYCEFVESQMKKNLEPTFAFEIFGGDSYLSSRFFIDYNNMPCILTLIIPRVVVNCNENKISICDTSRFKYLVNEK